MIPYYEDGTSSEQLLMPWRDIFLQIQISVWPQWFVHFFFSALEHALVTESVVVSRRHANCLAD